MIEVEAGIAERVRERSEELYKELSYDPLLWGRAYFPHHFRLQTPYFHCNLINGAMTSRFLAIASPRESSKSTLLVFLYPFHSIIFKKKRFILIVSNTFKKAAMHLDSIKKELQENELLTSTFSGIEVTKDAEGDSVIRHRDGFETKILCKGVDQIGSIRGVKFGAYRPDLIIGDDMEDDELVKNPQRRQELQAEFDEALIPAGEKGKCQYIFVGTILHDDCQLSKLVSEEHYPEYKKLMYKARLDNGESLWTEKWSKEYLLKLEKDKPTVFAKEYQNDPVAASNVRFKKEDFRLWLNRDNDYVLYSSSNQPISRGKLSDCKAAISCDLAWKDRRESDSSVIMPGFLTPNSEILIETYTHKKGMRPDELAELLFDLVDRLTKLTGSTVPVGFEKAMLENVTQWLLKREMRKRNRYILTQELVWDSDKNTRIETRLQPRYSQHVIYHRRGMGDLEHQLVRFPYGTHDDLIDAEQGLVQLLQYPKKASSNPVENNQFDQIYNTITQNKRPKSLINAYKRGNSLLHRSKPSKVPYIQCII